MPATWDKLYQISPLKTIPVSWTYHQTCLEWSTKNQIWDWFYKPSRKGLVSGWRMVHSTKKYFFCQWHMLGFLLHHPKEEALRSLLWIPTKRRFLQAELLGLLAIQFLMSALGLFFHLPPFFVKIWCDNSGALYKLKEHRCIIHTGASQIDIKTVLRNV